MRFHVLVACHNRRDLTVTSLMGADRAASAAGIGISFTVFDDGSSDGTEAAIAELPIQSSTIRGDGNAFWARSMATAEATVLSQVVETESDYVLWLNDDVVLDATALVRLVDCVRAHPNGVVVGAVRDPANHTVTYSGMRRTGRHPLGFTRVEPSDQAQRVDAFNGNIVAVPIHVARLLQGIDGGFSHGLADIDYGLRCNRLGVPVVLAPGTYGTCARNPSPERGSLSGDWTRFTGPKGGGHFGSLRRILRRSNPLAWPVFVVASYGLWWTRQIISRVLRP